MTAQAGEQRPRPVLERLVPVPSGLGPPSTPAIDIAGTDLCGAPLRVSIGPRAPRMLLLFLSSGCDGCRPFWLAAADPASLGLTPGEGVLVVVRDAGEEDVEALAQLVVPATPVVLSSQAWTAYRVQGPPFFAVVDGREGRVVTEGVAWAVAQVASDVRRHASPAGTGDS